MNAITLALLAIWLALTIRGLVLSIRRKRRDRETEDLMSQFMYMEEVKYKEMREKYGNGAPKALLNRLRAWWGMDPI